LELEDVIAIFDGHNDTVHKLREYRPEGIDFLERATKGHLDLARAREGGLVGGFFAMWVAPEPLSEAALDLDNLFVRATGYEVRIADALDRAYALRETRKQLAALQVLAARSGGQVRIATTVEAIEQARQDGAFAMVLHIEGADAIGPDLGELAEFHAAGLRSLGPVWSRPNIFGHGVPFAYPSSPDTGPGLTPLGMDLVRECNRLGVMLDLSHLNERGFWDVARLSTAPIVATHTCVHALCPSARNLTDRQLDAIRDSDGIVGVNLSVPDVRPDGQKDADTPLEMVVRHYAYLVERIGVERVAIGSDFDGTTIPAAIGDASGLPHLLAALRAHGFDDATLQKIAYENWMRVLRLSWR
jgi:membrane dipeptidase